MKKKYIGGMDFDEWQRQFDVMWDYSLKKINSERLDSTCRLYHCSASIEISAHYVCLTSYATLVAIFDVMNNTLYVRGRYSATTDQHICKFIKWLKSKEFEVTQVLQDYAKSDRTCGWCYSSTGGYRVYAEKVYFRFTGSDEIISMLKLPTYPC